MQLTKCWLTLLLLVAAALGTRAQQTEAPKLPATEAGSRVEAYLRAFNSGDEQAMRAFFNTHLPEAALKRRPVEDRLQVYQEMLGDMRRLELRRVVAASPDAIEILVQTGNEAWFSFRFQFEAAPPHKLLSLSVEDTEPPSAGATGAAASAAPLTEAEFMAAVEKHLAELVKQDEFSGVVLVARSGKPFFQKAVGLASKEFNVPNRLDTRFNLGSINKVFTQVAIGQLAEQGKLGFDDALNKHLPDYPNRKAAEKITIRHLLSMSSGIGDFFGDRYDAMPKDKLRTLKDYLPLFAAEPLAFEPGTKQQYSNGGYVVLGLIIEKISGQSYYDYVREHIFKPAGMEHTDSFEADAFVPNLASGYTRGERGAQRGDRRNNIYTRPARGSSAGGGYSTAEDLLRFTQALQSGTLRVPEFRKQEAGQGQPANSNNSKGLGIAGGAPGINAVVEHDPARGHTIIVMSNYDPPSATSVGRQIRQLLARVK